VELSSKGGAKLGAGVLTQGQVLSCSVDCRVTSQQWSEILLLFENDKLPIDQGGY
jgi:hypothetical protein